MPSANGNNEQYDDPVAFDTRIKKIVPGLFNMISSSADHQQSEEAENGSEFELPNPAGKAGGACTSAFLQALYDKGQQRCSWVDILKQMGTVLNGMGFKQTPQLTSSRLIDIKRPMNIIPRGSGKRRALLIGIRYVTESTGQLMATWNDVLNLREFLIEVLGFNEDEILVLMDDDNNGHHAPTKENIESALMRLTRYSQPGDVVFVSFSGHGGRAIDLDGDEDDGYDETLIPCDFKQNGQIVDDDLLKFFVKPMQRGVTTTVLMDCCHSGTVLDLPYTFGANDTAMSRERGFNMEQVGDDFVDQLEEQKGQKQQNNKKNNKKASQQQATGVSSKDNNSSNNHKDDDDVPPTEQPKKISNNKSKERKSNDDDDNNNKSNKSKKKDAKNNNKNDKQKKKNNSNNQKTQKKKKKRDKDESEVNGDDDDDPEANCGPMTDADGVPQLPVRRAQERGEDDSAPPPPPKKCVIM